MRSIAEHYSCYELFGMQQCAFNFSFGVGFMKQEELSPYEFVKHGWMSVLFTTDRGITHEIVRHRDMCSFAQESTRYCNYSNNKFGNEITVIDQGFEEGGSTYICWQSACKSAEIEYFNMIDMKVAPQMARSVLPTCVKADIVVTTTVEEWVHIFELRAIGTTGAPHPKMRELMEPLFKHISKEWKIKYNDSCINEIGGVVWGEI